MRYAFVLLVAAAVPLPAKAADQLPLAHGVFVDSGTACKGASTAATMSYWGGNNGLNVSQAECTIKTVTQKGKVYTLTRSCSGSELDGTDDTVNVVITNRKTFSPDGTTYRWCGMKVQF